MELGSGGEKVKFQGIKRNILPNWEALSYVVYYA